MRDMRWRRAEEKLLIAVSAMMAGITSLILLAIIGKIAFEALPSLTLYFLTTPEVDTPGLGQGIANAIVGTVYLSLLSVLLATPLAIGTAIYLKKYANDTIITRSFRFMIDVLSGTPSIVLGIFGLLFLVYYMKVVTGGFSLIAGAIALAILILPVIERASEEAIDAVPGEVEEASYALGATKWDTIRRITIPYSLSGIITGVILGIGRAAEESAVVILTAGYTQFLPSYGILPREGMLFGMKIYPFQDLVATLPISVYHTFEHSHIVPIANGFAAAFVLIIIVMLVNMLAKIVLWRGKIG